MLNPKMPGARCPVPSEVVRGARPPTARPILLVSAYYPPAVGGSPILFESIYSRLEGHGHDVTVLADVSLSPGAADAARGRLRVLRRPIAPRGWGVLDPRSLGRHVANGLRIRALARRAGAPLVHCARPLPEGLAALVARRLGGPRYLCWTHGEEVQYARTSRELTFLLRRVFAGATAAIANAHNTARLIRDVCGDAASPPIHVVHPGFDPERFRPAADGAAALRARFAGPDDLLLLSVGRLQRRKGHDLAIEAVAALREELPHLRYAIAGDGDERARLEALAAERGVADRVRFAGVFRDDEVPALYAACDIFLLPNRVEGVDIEGFGIVFIEAAAASKPAIGGRTGGVVEAVADGETGILVSGTDAAELAGAIRRLAASEDLRGRLGTAARERALREFTWERAAERVARIHADVCAPPAGP